MNFGWTSLGTEPMKFPFFHLRHLGSPSFALISVLALVSLAALTATAFLASARLERQATVSLSQSTVLEMALHAGANAAKEMLDYAPSKHFNFVTTYWRGSTANDWTNELGYLLNGAVLSTSVKTSTIYNYYACFSTATMTNLGTTNTDLIVVSNNIDSQGSFYSQMSNFMARMTNFATNTNSGLRECTNIPLLGDSPTNRFTSPPVGWIYIRQDKRAFGTTNTTSVPVARFAFYVQDLCGMIDAERMGGLIGGKPYRASLALPTNYTPGTNPAEIALTNLTGTALTAGSVLSNFVASSNRVRYLSPGLLAEPMVGGLNSHDLRYVATGLRHWSNAYERIPVGLGYSQSTQLKTNLNTFFNSNRANSDFLVRGIASAISNNLPLFASTNRSGAMPAAVYVSNIAANIVDYIDTDSIPTVGSNISSAVTNTNTVTYRGIESIPWCNETFTRLNLQARNTNPPNYQFELVVKQYVEVWNLGNTQLSDVASMVAFSNNLDIPLQCGNWRKSLKSADPANPPRLETFTNIGVVLEPNSYCVLSAPSRTFKFDVPIALAGTNTRLTINPPGSSPFKDFKYVYYLNTNPTNGAPAWFPIDGSPAGCLMGTTNMIVGSFHYICNSAGFATSPDGSAYNIACGDPRGQLFMRQPMLEIPWTSSSPGGRNWYSVALGKARIVDPPVNWPDRGHSLGDLGTDLGANPKPADQISSLPNRAGNKNHYVMKLNNTGLLSNICELGRIFDPLQWGDPNNPFYPRDNAAWISLSNTASPTNAACGRTTLHIGRPEFQRFAFSTNGTRSNLPTPNMSISSAALLDLFCTSSQYDESGQINLNTAPAPVLRALAGGIYLRSDAALTATAAASGNNYFVPGEMTEAFAQGVMRFRSQYPFYSPSQLPFIGTDPRWPNTNNWPSNAVFGHTNPATWRVALSAAPGNPYGSSATMYISSLNAEAHEEWFAKIYKLSTTYSRNFRVYVVAQLVDSNKIGYGPVARKYYHVVTRQNTDKATDVPPASASTFNSYESRY